MMVVCTYWQTAVDEAGRYQRAAVKARADYRKVVAARVKKATGTGGLRLQHVACVCI